MINTDLDFSIIFYTRLITNCLSVFTTLGTLLFILDKRLTARKPNTSNRNLVIILFGVCLIRSINNLYCARTNDLCKLIRLCPTACKNGNNSTEHSYILSYLLSHHKSY